MRLNARTSAIAVAMGVLGILTGCSDGDKPPSTDGVVARTALLELEDFPAGWVEQDVRTARSVAKPGKPIEQCIIDTGRTAVAVSRHFHTGPGTANFSETISVYESQAAATAAADQSDEMLECAASAFSNGAFDDDEISASGGRYESLEALDQTQRLYLLSADGFTSGDEAFEFHILVLSGSRGRFGFVFVMQFSVLPSRLLQTEFQSIAESAIARLPVETP